MAVVIVLVTMSFKFPWSCWKLIQKLEFGSSLLQEPKLSLSLSSFWALQLYAMLP